MRINIKTIIIGLFICITPLNLSHAISWWWWLPEYPVLIKKVETSKNHTLNATYKTGPDLQVEVKNEILKIPDKGLVFKKQFT